MLFSKQVALALASFLVPTFGSPILQERADGPGHPYTCASQYNAAAVKNSLLKAGANSRGIISASRTLKMIDKSHNASNQISDSGTYSRPRDRGFRDVRILGRCILPHFLLTLASGCDLDATHYPYGDKKTEDSANFGLFKNNCKLPPTSDEPLSGRLFSAC